MTEGVERVDVGGVSVSTWHYIGGRRVPSPTTFEDRSPLDWSSGGRRWRDPGLWYEPTLIEPRRNNSEVVQHEVFGPVLTLQTFVDEADAVALANSSGIGREGGDDALDFASELKTCRCSTAPRP